MRREALERKLQEEEERKAEKQTVKKKKKLKIWAIVHNRTSVLRPISLNKDSVIVHYLPWLIIWTWPCINIVELKCFSEFNIRVLAFSVKVVKQGFCVRLFISYGSINHSGFTWLHTEKAYDLFWMFFVFFYLFVIIWGKSDLCRWWKFQSRKNIYENAKKQINFVCANNDWCMCVVKACCKQGCLIVLTCYVHMCWTLLCKYLSSLIILKCVYYALCVYIFSCIFPNLYTFTIGFLCCSVSLEDTIYCFGYIWFMTFILYL